MESTLESVNKAEEMADKAASQAGFDEDVRGGISMAVREAMINAVMHGNGYSPDKRVKLTFDQTGGNLVITIRDEGAGHESGGGSGSSGARKSDEAIRTWNLPDAGIHG